MTINLSKMIFLCTIILAFPSNSVTFPRSLFSIYQQFPKNQLVHENKDHQIHYPSQSVNHKENILQTESHQQSQQKPLQTQDFDIYLYQAFIVGLMLIGIIFLMKGLQKTPSNKSSNNKRGITNNQHDPIDEKMIYHSNQIKKLKIRQQMQIYAQPPFIEYAIQQSDYANYQTCPQVYYQHAQERRYQERIRNEIPIGRPLPNIYLNDNNGSGLISEHYQI